ncbi:MAG: M23 family metallopeptidase [Polyangiaceae bacterium]
MSTAAAPPSSAAARPLVRAAALAALMSVVTAFVPERKPEPPAPSHAPTAASGLRAVCGRRAIPEGEACVPLPEKNAPIGPAEAARTPPSARDDAASATFLPRRPDRPAELSAYVLPLAIEGEVRVLQSPTGTRPPGERTGIDLAAPLGDKVLLAAVEGADDPAKVVFVGEDVGITIATLHTIREADAVRSVLVLYGHLNRPGPGIVPGARVHPTDVIGFVGDSGSAGVEQLYLEARLVRDGALVRLLVDDTAVPKPRLADDALSIPTDLRNILAPRTAPAPAPAASDESP